MSGLPTLGGSSTRPRLIVNADDFGLTPGVNRAIAELHEAGAVTSATLMARGGAFDDAVRLARSHPGLGVGCHIVFTDGVPVSPPETVRTLLGADGLGFRPSLGGFLLATASGSVRREELKREAVAQIRILQSAGIRVTHLDTHKHTHLLPWIAGPVLEAAEETGVPAVRNPFEQGWSLRVSQPPLLRLLSFGALGAFQRSFLRQPALRRGTVRTTGGTLGVSATGHLNRGTLGRLLEALPAGTWELVCHPGYNEGDLDGIPTRLRASREIEREALHALLSSSNHSKLPHRGGPELIHYSRL